MARIAIIAGGDMSRGLAHQVAAGGSKLTVVASVAALRIGYFKLVGKISRRHKNGVRDTAHVARAAIDICRHRDMIHQRLAGCDDAVMTCRAAGCNSGVINRCA